ncbi:MAG: PBP1A family penicillin-binding protein, partial [Gammaproteobacteria bacterium]|nr:PBP1A family penicillin-binding protein [Gammaproteobacteria bacterium]
MNKYIKALRIFLAVIFTAATASVIVIAAAYFYLAPGLPEIETLKDVKLTLPLRVYARDGGLIAEFGKERRTPVRYSNVPDLMIKAFLAAEDDRFFEHPGVDYQGLIRAALHLIKTGEKGQGGSTITMQVARNFFLSREKTFLRKFNEIFLSLKIEREIGKEEILELYLNVIYLGHRSYGVQAASQVYYGKNVHELNLAEIAMIAGLPKAPSRYNPIVNPQRALLRRNYVLGRMKMLNFISESQYNDALNTSVVASLHGLQLQVEAPYVAEMVRSRMLAEYGSEIYTRGFRVYTTIDSSSQKAANHALRKSLLDYDKRHGFRGVERNFVNILELGYEQWDQTLRDIPVIGGLVPGIVEVVEEKDVYIYLGKGKNTKLNLDDMQWARLFIDENKRGPALKAVTDFLKPGDLVRLQKTKDKKWTFSQIPKVAGALVSLSSRDGSILALVGGFDYFYSKFNRVTQAKRQPGSSFKPFIYTAALAKGFTPASIINDAPVVFNDPALESTWRPENYSGKFYGPTRLREALVHSRNLVSIRILRDIGIGYASRFLKKFGITRDMIQKDLSLALGSGSISPLELARAYAVIANGGYRVEPYFIDRIEEDDGEVIFSANPAIACLECEQQIEKDKLLKAAEDNEQAVEVIEAENNPVNPVNLAKRSLSQQDAYLIHSIMRDVVRRGTGRG